MILSNHILKLMSKEDRKSLGKNGLTMEEIIAKTNIKKEKDMHDLFASWLDLHGIPFIHARMDKKSTIKKGAFDFTILYYRLGICVEFKMPGGSLTVEQEQYLALLNNAQVPAFVCHSVSEAIFHTRDSLCIFLQK